MAFLHHSLEKSGMVPVEGGEIHYRLYEPHDEEKAKRTPLVFVHGGPGASHAYFHGALDDLADDQPVLFYDQLGSYYSPAKITKELARLDRFVDELACLVQALGFSRFKLLGHSWGGAIATAFAHKHPEKVEKLLLSSPLLSMKKWIADCRLLLKQLPIPFDEVIACEQEGKTDSEVYQKANDLFTQAFNCRLKDKPSFVQKHRKKRNGAVYTLLMGPSEFSCTGTLKDLDLFPLLPEIKTPAVLFCGTFDTATPATMKEAQNLMSNAVVEVLEGCGHQTFLDDNQAFLAALRKHLQD